jgi:hypothetical protein
MKNTTYLMALSLLLASCLKQEKTSTTASIDTQDSTQFTIVNSTSDENCIPFKMPTYVEAVFDAKSGKVFKCNGWGGGDSCQGNFEYQGFDLSDTSFYLWMNFKPEILTGYTTKSLRDNYRWLWFQFKISQDGSGEDSFISPRTFASSVDSLDNLEYVNGRLKISEKGTIKKMYLWIEPKGSSCSDTDVGAKVCACEYDVDIKYKVSLDLPLQIK